MNKERQEQQEREEFLNEGVCFACNADISHAAGGDGYRLYRQAAGKPEGETDAEVELCESCHEEAKRDEGIGCGLSLESDVLSVAQFDILSAWIQTQRRENGLNGLSERVEVLDEEAARLRRYLRDILATVYRFDRTCTRAEYTDVGMTWDVIDSIKRDACGALGKSVRTVWQG